MSTDNKEHSSRKVYIGPSDIPARTQYLALYNLFSFILWLVVFLQLVLTATLLPLEHSNAPTTVSNIYWSISPKVRWIQTLAILEVIHSLVGIVRASVITTAIQVASRILLVWGITWLFGEQLMGDGSVLQEKMGSLLGFRIGILDGTSERNQLAYAFMLLAWSITEVIRYLYFVNVLGSDPGVPPTLTTFLRYNTFFVLYPVGISCECWLIYQTIPYAEQWNPLYAWFLRAVLVLYVPGSYIMYTHMIRQRRRMRKGKQKSKTG